MCNFRSRDDVSLANGLQGIDSKSITLANLHDFAKGTLADDLEQFKRVDSKRLTLCRLERHLNVDST